MHMTPENIIAAMDLLPRYAQEEVFDALVPPNLHGSRLANLHRIPDLTEDLRREVEDEADTAIFDSAEAACAKVGDLPPEDAMAIAVALADGNKYEDEPPAHRMILAALDMVSDAMEGRSLDETDEIIFEHAVKSLQLIAAKLKATFRYNGKYWDTEQVRPWLDAYRQAAKLHNTMWSLQGKVIGLAGSPYEAHGLSLLRSLDEHDRHCDEVLAIQSEVDAVTWIAPTDTEIPVGTEWRFDEVIVCVQPGRGRTVHEAIMRYPKGKIRFMGVTHGGDVHIEAFKQRATVNGDRIPANATIIVKGSKA